MSLAPIGRPLRSCRAILLLVATVALSGSFLLAAPATRPSIEQKTQAMLDQWKPKIEKEKLNWVLSPPFLLAGDGPVEQLNRYRDGTVLSAQQALSAMYFKTPPDKPIMILLFESAAPYERLSKEWFDEENPSHFGYCMHDGTMVMNVSTGTGTLVHELVHALIRPDFPNVPTWFNEGMGSLYEQSQIAPQSIKGLVNWRLPPLQRALRAKAVTRAATGPDAEAMAAVETVRSLQEMIEDPEFYGQKLRGMNYAQARYLLMYLQEKGLLKDYYRQFRESIAADPTGLKTLKTVIKQGLKQDWDAFEKDWQTWVLSLER